MWKFLSNFKEFYNEINSATLTGAIDVIVVQQEDGTYSSSPFHVRFGKIGVLRSREKVVDIEINGQPVDIHMKLGESGEAFFVEETDDKTEVPSYLATSPIPVYPDIRKELELLKKELPDDNDVPAPVQVITPSSNKSPLLMESSFESALAQLSNAVTSLNASTATLPSESAFPSVLTDVPSNGSITYETIPTTHPKSLSEAVELCEVKDAIIAKTVKIESTTGNNVLTASSSFRPIKADEDSSILPLDSELRRSPGFRNVELGSECAEVVIDIEDDKTKTKKKRRRKSTIRRKQQNRTKETTYTPESREVSCKDSISSEDQNEEIFQMDMLDDNLIINSDPSTTLSKMPVGSLQLSNELCDREEWHPKSLQIPLPYSPYSDGEISPAASPSGSRPSTPKSDTEYEIQKMEAASQTESDQHQWSWTWGELPVPPKVPTEKDKEEPFSDDDSTEKAKQIMKDQEEQRSRFGGVLQFMGMSKKDRQKQESEGVYLDDLNVKDPEMAALYFSRNSTWSSQVHGKDLQTKDEDVESGNGSSLPQSPHSVEGAIGGPVTGTDSDSDERNATTESGKTFTGVAFSLCGNLSQFDGEVPFEKFEKFRVTYENFCNNPNLFMNPNLVVRIDDKYYNWQTATPILMSLVVFQRPLPESIVTSLVKDHMPKKTRKTEGRSWWYWRRPAVSDADSTKTEIIKDEQKALSQENGFVPSQDDKQNTELIMQSNGSEIKVELRNKEHSEKYKKSLRLTSEQIAKLKLKQGPNEVVFSVTTAYQGTTRCKCHIYLWKHDDQVVISDIDGTITKSDVLGHILPIVGKSWAQSGVAQLFTQIKDNGYQFLYLSARAIGQARITREYLRSIRQGDVSLPDGPLLLSPSSLISALHREVIEKKPEEFKISCLRDIQALFNIRNPFYAGYGNKINDVWAYRAIGIPMARIFTINPKGELKHERNRTFQSSYSGLSYVVDHVFPPLIRSSNNSGCLTTDFVGAEEFSSYTYWRCPLPDIELDLEAEKSKCEKSKVAMSVV